MQSKRELSQQRLPPQLDVDLELGGAGLAGPLVSHTETETHTLALTSLSASKPSSWLSSSNMVRWISRSPLLCES